MPDEPFALDGAPPDAAVIGVGVARVLLLCEPLHIADCPPRAAREEVGGEALPDDIAQLATREAPKAKTKGKGEAKGEAKPTAPGAPRLELLAGTAGGAPNVVSLQVVRAEHQGFKELDEVFLSLQLPMAQALVYGKGQPKATAIMVQLRHTADLAAARERLQALIARVAPNQPLAVLDFRELNPFFVQTVQMFDAIFGFIFLLIGSIVLFTVGNTMSTAVMERTVEIGTVRALGVRRAGVRRLFVLEGLLLGVAGATTGVVLALLGAAIVNRLGLHWVPPGSGEPLPLLLIVWGETPTIVGTMLGLIAIAGLSAWWPAHRASKLVIVDALRHV
jgi:putative ABC transport system permease protein